MHDQNNRAPLIVKRGNKIELHVVDPIDTLDDALGVNGTFGQEQEQQTQPSLDVTENEPTWNRHQTKIEPPKLDPIAYHGPVGAIVQKMLPHTEASGPSLLMQGLVLIGNLIGRRAWTLAGARDHFPNLYAVTVGESAVGRKGEALEMLKRYVFPTITDGDWIWPSRIVGGAASAEGIIFALRDKTDQDAGAEDKRLLLEESEFGGMLDVINRENNKLGALLRDAWDGRDLNNLAMKNRDAKTKEFLKARDYHLSLNGHITKAELKEKLPVGSRTANGLANRILWTYSLREKLLPRGGKFSAELIFSELQDLRGALDFTRKNCRVFAFDGEAENLYADWYNSFHKRLEKDDSELARIISRGDAQIKRLSLLFALLDKSPFIRSEHLNAASALWDYCEISAKWAFYDNRFSPTAQRIYDFLELQPGQLSTLAYIQKEVFHNHLDGVKLNAGVDELVAEKVVARVKDKTGSKNAHRPPTTIQILGNPDAGLISQTVRNKGVISQSSQFFRRPAN